MESNPISPVLDVVAPPGLVLSGTIPRRIESDQAGRVLNPFFRTAAVAMFTPGIGPSSSLRTKSLSVAMTAPFALADPAPIASCSALAPPSSYTRYRPEASVLSVYPNATETLGELRRLGVAVYHEVDATELQATLPPPHSFDRIVWNFPCIGRGLEAGHDGQNEQMDANKELVRRFGRSACALLRPGGEVHVGHKTKPPYNHWSIVEQVLARSELRHRPAGAAVDRARACAALPADGEI